MKFFGVFLCEIYLVAFADGGYFHCSDNEVPENCKKSCQPTCQTPRTLSCDSSHCQPGCVCRPGTIRDEATGRCISLQYCPIACSWNEVQNNGRNGCEQICQNQHLGFHCVFQNKRCVCKPGLLRDLNSGECVPQQLCPKVQCEVNEEWNLCTNPLFRRSCQNRFKKQLSYPSTCIPGCDCKKGFIWDEYSKRCIPEYQCPKVCGENQEWTNCNNFGRKDTCQRRTNKVNTKMCMGSCSCKDSYLWDEHYKKCVPREHCSKVCRENEEWCESVSNDVATCQNILKPQCHKYFRPSFISLKSGCICREGLIWNEVTEKCVLLEECPNIFTTTTLSANAVTSTTRPTTVVEPYTTTEATTSITSTTVRGVSSVTPTSLTTGTESSTTISPISSTPTISTTVVGTGSTSTYSTAITEHSTINTSTNTTHTTTSSNSTPTLGFSNTHTSTGTTPTNAVTTTKYLNNLI